MTNSLIDGAEENAYKCYNLKSLNIPVNVSKIGTAITTGCDNLEILTVSDGNTHYHSDGNCIIEISSKTLIAGCKTSVIPDDGSVEIIGESVFQWIRMRYTRCMKPYWK